MKTRATSFLLAALAVVSLVLPALAADPDKVSVETPAENEVTEELRHAVLLDGEPAESVEFEVLGGVCYVTVSSFASLMDPEAMVAEENGTVSVSSWAVTEVVTVSDETGEAQTASVVTDQLNMVAIAGVPYVAANNRYLYAKDGVIQLNDRVAAPVRVLARAYNLNVSYDAGHDLVLLSRQEGASPYLADGSEVYDADTLYWLSHLIYAESGNQPLEGKIAVGNVVMNRVKDPRFPDNIHDVLFQKNQFTTVLGSSFYRNPNWESTVAAMLVMDGAEVLPTALFFNGVSATNSYAAKNRTYVTTIGAHAFYK